MYRVETHDNSKNYFKTLNIEKNSLYVVPTITFKNMIINLNDKKEDELWNVIDIQYLIEEIIYRKFYNKLDEVKLRGIIRKIIFDLIGTSEDESVKKELKYFLDNIGILLSDIRFLAIANINKFKYTKETLTKKTFNMIFTELIKTEEYLNFTSEILNPILCSEFYKNIKNWNGEKVNKIYFYNLNNLDLLRWTVIELLKQSGFEVVFKIPYFQGLKATNKCWDMVYGNKKIFTWNKTLQENKTYNCRYINFIEGRDGVKDNNEEKVITKTYNEVEDFKNSIKNKLVITFHKDSLKALKNRKQETNHCFQTIFGKFFINLYKCEIRDQEIYIRFNEYRELITSGWIECSDNSNGVKLRGYLCDNSSYFDDIKSMSDILNRLNSLKKLEEVNYIFEEPVSIKIKGNEQKKFLSNPFRALGYNNAEQYDISVNSLISLTKKLRAILLKALNNKNGLIDIEKHFEILRKAFNNNYIRRYSNSKNNIEKEAVRLIWNTLKNTQNFMKEMYKEEILDILSVLLKFNKNNIDNEFNKLREDFSVDQLEGIILSMNKGDTIFISDLSYKAYEEYQTLKHISGKILKEEDLYDIFSKSLSGKHKEVILRATNLRKLSIDSSEAYLKFIFANLFFNFAGTKELSWISSLRNDDDKSIILKQIEVLYEHAEEVKSSLSDGDKDVQGLDKEVKAYEEKTLIDNYKKYSDVAFRDLDFCGNKFLYSSVLNPYPMYYLDFHCKLVFSEIIAILKNSINDSYLNLSKFIFPLFPQWQDVVKDNIMICEYGKKNMRDYKFFENLNYPKNIYSLYLLRSKYVVGENWKIKNRYNKGNFNSKEYYEKFVSQYISDDYKNSGSHCMMCPHIYLCRKGGFAIDFRKR